MTTTTLYRFFDADDRLLYVGITGRSVARWAEHSKSKPWWPQVVRTTVEHHADRAAALEAERAAIKVERPEHNIMHAVTLAPAKGRKRIAWRCDVCGQLILDGEGPDGGWLTVNNPRPDDFEPWKILHARCDPDDRGSYWFTVDRIRTAADLAQWDEHLREKRWVMDRTDWWAIAGMALELLEVER